MTLNKCMSLILLSAVATSAVAQSSTGSIESVKKGPNTAKSWTARIDSTVYRDLLKTSEADHTSGMTNSFRFSYATDIGSFTFKTSMSKSFVDERKSNINDSSFSYSRKAARPFEGVVSFGSISAGIPTSKVSRRATNLRTKLSISEGLSISDSVMRVKNLSALLILAASKNFHEYKTSLYGTSNTSYSVSSIAYLTYSFTDSFYLSLGGTYAKGWTYENNTKDLYSFSQSMGYSFSPTYNLEVGHEFGGTPLSPDGKDVEIDLFDERESSVYATLTIKI
ncbi:hypothetical protein [Halobacteriovorax sp.]|uniref:hypothetical protein n=1 Tax=Halobacteriovorax sp. TaxID=2020862 RepID=UPI003AF2C95F